jgi:hypothetical protein
LFFVSTSTAKGYSENVHGTFEEVKGTATSVAMTNKYTLDLYHLIMLANILYMQRDIF